jgi:hypothetical protein
MRESSSEKQGSDVKGLGVFFSEEKNQKTFIFYRFAMAAGCRSWPGPLALLPRSATRQPVGSRAGGLMLYRRRYADMGPPLHTE